MLKVTVLSASLAAGIVLTGSMPVNAADHEEPPVIASTGSTMHPPEDPGLEQPGRPYVALGDSFAAGTGARDYIDDSPCFRSKKSYPKLLGEAQHSPVTLLACAGRTTTEIMAEQVGSVQPMDVVITLQAGGNDASFSPVLQACMQPETTACSQAITQAKSVITNELPARLDKLYDAVRARAPRAKIIVVGYPRLFSTKRAECKAAPNISRSEMTQMNEAVSLMESVVKQAANRGGVDYVSATSAFAGHGLCDRVPWIEGASPQSVGSFHPNVAGNRAYARLLRAYFKQTRTGTEQPSPESSASPQPSSTPSSSAATADRDHNSDEASQR